MIWNAAIYWTRVMGNIVFVELRLTLVYLRLGNLVTVILEIMRYAAQSGDTNVRRLVRRLWRTSAANLKFLSWMPQVRLGTSNSKPH